VLRQRLEIGTVDAGITIPTRVGEGARFGMGCSLLLPLHQGKERAAQYCPDPPAEPAQTGSSHIALPEWNVSRPFINLLQHRLDAKRGGGKERRHVGWPAGPDG